MCAARLLLSLSLILDKPFSYENALQVSLAVAAAALIAAEVLRVGAVPGLGLRINTFMTSFIDSRYKLSPGPNLTMLPQLFGHKK